MRKTETKHLLNYLQKYSNKEDILLDVGCGIGRNLDILKDNGYKNIIGVDISDTMVATVKDKGYEAYTISTLTEGLRNRKIKTLLFSHVLEHISYENIQSTMESYFSFCADNANVVILMPTLYDAFYNDVDHIKPYYPSGLVRLFSKKTISKQYFSDYELVLKNLKLRKAPLIPFLYSMELRYETNILKKIIFKIFNKIMKGLKWITFGYISKTTGYVAIFELKK